MVLRLCCFSLVVLVFALPSFGQAQTCDNGFGAVVLVESDEYITQQASIGATVIAWTSPQCMLIGSATGLWLIDIDHPDNPYHLAYQRERAVGNVAVNPEDGSIAFSFVQDRAVHRLYPGGTVSTLEAGGRFVTDLGFSSDGTLLAVASMDYEDNLPGTYSPRVQFWRGGQMVTDIVTSEIGSILGLDFSIDDQYVLIHRQRSGYIGDQIELWNIDRAERVWSYDDLLRGLEQWSENDPLAVTSVTMRGDVLALGGLDGYMNWDEYYGTAVHLWNPEMQERRAEIVISRRMSDNDENALADISLNSDGFQLATARRDGRIQLWNTIDGSQIAEFSVNTLQTAYLAFSPDDRLLAIVNDSEITIWDMQRMEQRVQLDVLDFPTQFTR